MFIRLAIFIVLLPGCLRFDSTGSTRMETDDAGIQDGSLPACAMGNPAYTVERPDTNNLYRLVDDVINWHNAVTTCEADGAHLVVLDDAAEDNFVQSMFSTPIWLGLTDEAQEGVFAWIDGTPVNYVNWGPDEPNNERGVEHYVKIRISGQWNDTDAEGGGNTRAVCECELL